MRYRFAIMHPMSYKEKLSQVFHYQTTSTVYGLFSEVPDMSDQSFMSSSQVSEKGLCQLRILQDGERTTVIATEIAMNTGKSVTNAAEAIATQAARTFRLDPTKTRFIEHYSKESFEGRNGTEVWDEVVFQWSETEEAHTPRWRRLQPQEIAALNDIE